MKAKVWFLALLLSPWALLAQAAPAQLSEAQARHLLLRTGFAPTQAEVDQLTGRPTREAVFTLVEAAKAARPRHAPPDFVSAPPPVPLVLLKTREEQQAMRQQQQREGLDLKRWWMREMIDSPTPLAERMTLFWHGHFATSQQKVVRSQGMWRQHLLLREHALGSFRQMLHAVAKDPAMLVYLDGANSRKEAPNENFAREVMELFTLGEATQPGLGGYTEQDIKEAARAFTGWSIERDSFSYRYRPAMHDHGSKTVLGRSGRWDGDEVLDILLEQPAAARFVAGKLWREFVSPQPDAAALELIARRWRTSGYDIAVLMQELLLSDAFWDDAQHGSLIKSPVELIVGTVRQLAIDVPDPMPLALKSAQLGQNLLVPPNVKGWPGYTEWINSSSLLERKRWLEGLTRSAATPMADRQSMSMEPSDTMRPVQLVRADLKSGSGAGSNRQLLQLLGPEGRERLATAVSQIRFQATPWLAGFGAQADRELSPAAAERIEQTLLALPPTSPATPGTVALIRLRQLTLDPVYQLK